jgi:hypothetical protein
LNIGICASLKAQQPVTVDSVISLLRQMKQGYDSSRNLSFDMAYIYTSENKPGEILDSLSGHMEISRGRYHWNISNTESIANAQYAVMLFKDDKLMYITRPMQKDGSPDPFAMLDSSLFRIQGLKCNVEKTKEIVTITIDFPEGISYKQIKIAINKKTGFVASTAFTLKAAALNHQYGFNDENLKTDNSYAHIEARYFNYNTEVLNDSVFDQNSYFKKTGKEFSTVAPYTDYKIFIGSPNL